MSLNSWITMQYGIAVKVIQLQILTGIEFVITFPADTTKDIRQ